jgi:integrase
MFAWGIEHGRVRTNPFASVRLAAAPVKERFLSPKEMKALWDALQALESTKEIAPAFADIIRMLMLTGARKTEITGLRWSEVDLGRRRLTLPPERTKAGGRNGARHIRLSPKAATILARRHDQSEGDYVFPSARSEGHAVGVRRPFLVACKAAGMTDLRIHDLRHSYASALASNGQSLPMIAKALGHAGTRATERYAHLADDPLHAAACEVADLIFNSGAANAA